MTLTIVEADLLNNDLSLDIICHQTNSLTFSGGGIAGVINRKFPYADRFIRRKYQTPIYSGKYDVYDLPGSVDLERKKGYPTIACLCGQLTPGGPGSKVELFGKTFVEDGKTRELWFKQCLDTLADLLHDQPLNIGFPYRIGCGIACGDWDRYLEMLEQFALSVPKCKVWICKFE